MAAARTATITFIVLGILGVGPHILPAYPLIVPTTTTVSIRTTTAAALPMIPLIITAVEVVELVSTVVLSIVLLDTTLPLPPQVVMLLAGTAAVVREVEGSTTIIRCLPLLGRNVATLILMAEGLPRIDLMEAVLRNYLLDLFQGQPLKRISVPCLRSMGVF